MEPQVHDNEPELVNSSEIVTTGAQTEDSALRLFAEYARREYHQRMASLLPQVRPPRMGKSILTNILAGTVRVQEAPIKVWLDELVVAERHDDKLCGNRADVVVVDDLAAQGWDFSGVEKRLQAWMDETIRTGSMSRIYDNWYSGVDYSPEAICPECRAEICDRHTRPIDFDLFLALEPGVSEDRTIKALRRHYSRRSSKRNKGR